jgi:hypothetical protein
MRISWCLLTAGLLALGPCVTGCHARARAPAKAKRAPKAPPRVPEEAPKVVEVDGYGRTAADAEATALENAQAEVRKELQRHFAKTGWQPPADRLQPDYLRRNEVIWAGEKKEVTIAGEPKFKAVYKVELKPAFMQELDQLAREHFLREREAARTQLMLVRHLLLARVLAGLLVVLLVVFGYLRLEAATRGYYTRALRLVAAGVVVLVGLGLWLSV